MQTSQYQI